MRKHRIRRASDRGPVDLNVTVAGSGPAVVLIPSLGRGSQDFADLASRLADAGWQALAVDPRGIGSSTGPMTDIDLHDLAADVAAVVAAMSPDGGAHVVGHAFGNRVARCLATDSPERLKRLVLLAAGGQTPPDPAAVEAFRRFLDGGLDEAATRAAMAVANFAPTSDPESWTRDWWLDAAAAQIAAAKATELADWWQAFTAPTLIVQGLDDRMAPPENGRALAASAPPGQVTLVELADAGHALLPEQPDAIARHVIAFLGSL